MPSVPPIAWYSPGSGHQSRQHQLTLSHGSAHRSNACRQMVADGRFSTRGPRHSSSSVKKKHQLFPTSAILGELATNRARVTGPFAAGQGVAVASEEPGSQARLSSRLRSSRLRAWSTGRSDSFGFGGASGPSQRPGLPGATGTTEIKLQLQLPSRRALCH